MSFLDILMRLKINHVTRDGIQGATAVLCNYTTDI